MAKNAPTPTHEELEERIVRADFKLAALDHLLANYQGGNEFPETAAHGLSWILCDIRDALSGDDE